MKKKLMNLLVEPCLVKVACDITSQTKILFPNSSYEQLEFFKAKFSERLKENYLNCTANIYNLSIGSLNGVPSKMISDTLVDARIAFEAVDYTPLYISIFKEDFSDFLGFRVNKVIDRFTSITTKLNKEIGKTPVFPKEDLETLLITSALEELAKFSIRQIFEERTLLISPIIYRKCYNSIFSFWKIKILLNLTSKEFAYFKLCK